MTDHLKAVEEKLKTFHNPKQLIEDVLKVVADLLDGLTNDPVAVKTLAADLRQHAPRLAEAHRVQTQYTEPPVPQPEVVPTVESASKVKPTGKHK